MGEQAAMGAMMQNFAAFTAYLSGLRTQMLPAPLMPGLLNPQQVTPSHASTQPITAPNLLVQQAIVPPVAQPPNLAAQQHHSINASQLIRQIWTIATSPVLFKKNLCTFGRERCVSPLNSGKGLTCFYNRTADL